MRKSFITKEYSIEDTAGTLNMVESRNFLASKVLEIEDTMIIGQNDISWSENYDHTQGIGMDNYSLKVDMFDMKQKNHSIRIFPNQSEFDKKEFTRWEFNFKIKEMIRKYIFAQLKSNKTFASITNNDTLDSDVNKAIYQYIDANVLPRIKFQTIEMYIRYYQISSMQDNGKVALQYDSTFRKDLLQLSTLSGESTNQYEIRLDKFKQSTKVKNFQLTTDINQDVATIVYKQIQSSQTHKFDYYFDVIYIKA